MGVSVVAGLPAQSLLLMPSGMSGCNPAGVGVWGTERSQAYFLTLSDIFDQLVSGEMVAWIVVGVS
jgi:hypothetical protein